MTPPLKGSPRVSYPFGWRTHPTTGARNFHEGVDYAVGNGTPTYAALGGTVHSSGNSGGAGNYVIIQVNSTTRIRYNHLQSRAVTTGQRVFEGQLIGRTNNTGNSSGPHLHFAVYRLSGGKWVAIEPTAWLRGGQPAGSGSTPARDLYGADWVKTVQTKLIVLGYDIGSTGADGMDGPKTQAAVKDFQKKNGLTVDGIAGPATNAAIDKALGGPGRLVEDGSFGPNTIKALQVALGFTGSAVDGSFGPDTIKALQKALGATVDGSFGPNTIMHLQVLVGATVDGSFGTDTVTKLQKFLNSGRAFEKTTVPDGVTPPPAPKPAAPRTPTYPGASKAWTVPLSKDRDEGSVINRFIVHHTATTADQEAYFKQANDRASCPTWYVRTTGEVLEFIEPSKRPSSTGSANTYSWAVETQNETGSPSWGITQASEDAIAEIIAWLHVTYHGKTMGGFKVDLPIDREHVIGHNEAGVNATACPGPDMNLDYIVERARQLVVPEPEPEPTPGPAMVSVPRGDLSAIRDDLAQARAELDGWLA